MASASYSPEAYSSLPTLHDAHIQYSNLSAESKILGPIRDLFLQYAAHKRYGITLLHKHMSIEPTQRLVEYGNTSTPWEVGDSVSAEIDKYEGKIVPRAFRRLSESFVPYEFGYYSEGTDPTTPELHLPFLEKLGDMLADYKLDLLLGLRDLDQREPGVNVEVTEGKANMMMPRGSVPEEQLIPALWTFGVDEDDRCNCREYCYKSSSGDHTGKNHGCG